ncbi:MAG: peptidylprolyl isomerase [Candidatus Delongbacteria bacterium]|nr:peptidylprolyl isomerase [Candidatus Delongbacteria bacterium]
MRFTLSLMAVILLFAMTCSGKKEEGLLIVEVGSQKYYSETFWSMFQNSKEYRTAGWDSTAVIVNYLNEKVVPALQILEDAEQKGIRSDSTVQARLEQLKIGLLTNRGGPLFNKYITEAVKVTEKDAREVYDKLKNRWRLSDIQLADQEMADSVHQLLVNGADFKAMVQQFSIDEAAKTAEGDIGYRSWDDPNIPGRMKEVIFKLKVGEFSEPISTMAGHHIIKAMEVVPYEGLKSFEEEKERLMANLNSQATAEKIEDFITMIREKADFKYNEFLFGQIQDRMKQDSLPVIDFRDSTFFTQEELDAYFMSYSIRKFSLKEFIAYLKLRAPYMLRQFHTFDELKDRLENEVLFQEMMYQEALSLGMDKEPSFQDELKKRTETIILEHMKQMEVNRKVQITEEDKKDFYQKNTESLYFIKPEVSLRIITTKDKAKIDQAQARLKKKEDFSIVAKDLSDDRRSADRGGFFGSIDKRETRHDYLLRELKRMSNNQISGVIRHNGDYIIIQKLSETEQGVMPYEKVARNVERELYRLKSEEIETQYMNELKAKYPQVFNEENIRKVILMRKTEKAQDPNPTEKPTK